MKYRVNLSATDITYGTIEVEADSVEEARSEAEARMHEDPDAVEWEQSDQDPDVSIDEVEEVKD